MDIQAFRILQFPLLYIILKKMTVYIFGFLESGLLWFIIRRLKFESLDSINVSNTIKMYKFFSGVMDED